MQCVLNKWTVLDLRKQNKKDRRRLSTVTKWDAIRSKYCRKLGLLYFAPRHLTFLALYICCMTHVWPMCRMLPTPLLEMNWSMSPNVSFLFVVVSSVCTWLFLAGFENKCQHFHHHQKKTYFVFPMKIHERGWFWSSWKEVPCEF